MGFWSRLSRTLRADRRDRYEGEIDEEIQFHLAMKARDGLSAREARLRFGPPDAIRQETRAAGLLQWLESLLQDAGYGLRQLRTTPALTLAVLLSLTIGIGANTAIFDLVDAALIKDLPVPDPASLVVVHWTSHTWPKALATGHSGTTEDETPGHLVASSFGPKLYRKLAQDLAGGRGGGGQAGDRAGGAQAAVAAVPAVAALIGFTDGTDATIVPNAGIAQRVRLQFVSDNFFQGLEVVPALGRPFLPDDDRPDTEPAVIISFRLWQQHFSGRADIVDQPLRLNGALARVVGVAPAGFFGNQIGAWTDVYTPLAARAALGVGSGARNRADVIEADGYWWVRMMARLKPGVNPAAAADAQNQLSLLFQRLVVPDGVRVEAAQMPSVIFRPGARGFDAIGGSDARPLWLLFLLVALVLLIVCANVANLLLSRAVARQREAAVRLALGSGRWRLMRQQLVESLVLAVLGGAVGLALGVPLAQAIQAFVGLAGLAVIDVQISGRLIAYSAGLSCLTALVFGCAPALRIARTDFNGTLKVNNRSISAGRLRLPRVLVTVQIALCLSVLVAASLLGRSLAKLRGVDLGFGRERLVYVTVNPWRAGYHPAQVGPYVDRLRAALEAVPGVSRGGLISERPLQGGISVRSAHVPGRVTTGAPSTPVLVHRVSDGLIETLGLSVLAGRSLEPRDITADGNTIVVDETLAKRLFPSENAVGRSLALSDTDQREIVGVVSASRYDSVRNDMKPIVYQPWVPAGSPGFSVHVALRTSADPRAILDVLRHTAAAVDGDVPIEQMTTQSALVDGRLGNERMLSLLSNAFGLVAVILAGVGLAVLLVYSISRRTNEIGVRMALGAAPGQVATMVLGDSLRLLLAGIVLGLPSAYVIARLLRGTLFDTQPTDPVSASLAIATLATVAALAAWLPARRAARIDPIAALREE